MNSQIYKNSLLRGGGWRLSMKFQLLIIIKILKNKDFLPLSNSQILYFIVLINLKMPTVVFFFLSERKYFNNILFYLIRGYIFLLKSI